MTHRVCAAVLFLYLSVSALHGMSESEDFFAAPSSPLVERARSAWRGLEERCGKVRKKLSARKSALDQSLEERRVFWHALRRNRKAVGAFDRSSEPLASAFAENVPPGFEGEVVDAGAGTGPITAEALKRLGANARLIAVERDPEMAAFIERRFADEVQKGRLRVYTGEIESFIREDARQYPFVLCSIPLTQLSFECLSQLCGDLEKLVKPGGMLVSEELWLARPSTWLRQAANYGLWELLSLLVPSLRNKRDEAKARLDNFTQVWRLLNERDQRCRPIRSKWISDNSWPTRVDVRSVVEGKKPQNEEAELGFDWQPPKRARKDEGSAVLRDIETA